MATPPIGDISWDRMIRAVEKVRERLHRSVSALERAGVSYAVAGGHAVAAWVSRVDEGAVRNTPDVDLLVRRADFGAAAEALTAAGFVQQPSTSLALFLDGPQGKEREAVYLFFAGEKVHPDAALPAPDVTESEPATAFRVLTLEALVRLKLTTFRHKDRVHLRDLLDVGLIDATWCQRFPPELGMRLQELVDTPDG